MRFTGRGQDHEVVCPACAVGDVEMCAACFEKAKDWSWEGFVGEPELVVRETSLWFDRERVTAHGPKRLAVAPLVDGDRARWLVAGADARFWRWDLDDRSAEPAIAIPPDLVDLAQPITLKVSRDGSLAAIANTRGVNGGVVDLATGAVTMRITRDGYQVQHCNASLAFLARAGRTLVVYASAWNRLDVADARTGEVVTARQLAEYERGGARPEHYLDYFHCELHVSPGEKRIADTGWIWAPVGEVNAWSLDRWLDDNVWESEDGASKKSLGWRHYDWDRPFAWVDDDRAALFGYGEDDTWMLNAARIVDAATGTELRWIFGPRGAFVVDRYLISIDDKDGAAVWDIDTGARLAREPALVRAWWHPGAKVLAHEGETGEVTTWRLCGHDADAPWMTDKLRALAASLREDARVGMDVLGDALEEAGCPDDSMLVACRTVGSRARRSWVVDRIIHKLHTPQH